MRCGGNGAAVTCSYDGAGRTWTYEYDRLGRVVKEYDPLVEEGTDRFTEYQYDNLGNLTLTINNNLVRTTREYDKLSRLVKVIEDQWHPHHGRQRGGRHYRYLRKDSTVSGRHFGVLPGR